MSGEITEIQSLIDSNAVMVFSKSYCPYCKQTKSLLSSLDAQFKVWELDEMDNGREIQDALKQLTGQGTVPNIFIGGEHIGGNSDLQALKKDKKLEEKLKGVGALE